MGTIKYSILTVLIWLIAGNSYIVAMGKLPSQQQKPQLQVEPKSAYNFNLKNLKDGKNVKLSDFAGKPLFIDFWASWCPPCRQASPFVEKLHSEFKDKANIIGINLDANKKAALKYISKNSIKNMQLAGAGTEAPNRYAVRGIPAFFIIDKNGMIVNEYIGFMPDYYQQWIDILNKLSKEKKQK